jgi:hypothetical protein
MLELMQPSIPRCNTFPLFLRRAVNDFQREDVAFNAFFGRPILIEEHHELFKDPSLFLELVSMINTTVPQVQWCNLQTSLESACLIRQTTDGTSEVRLGARAGRIANPGRSPLRCVAEWHSPQLCRSGVSVLVDGIQCFDTAWNDVAVRASFEVAPGTSRAVAMHYNTTSRNSFPVKQSFTQKARVYLRRRASELRDNVLSKSPTALSLVKSARSLYWSL